MLILQFSVVLNAQLMFKNIPDTDSYETCILQWFERVLKSDDEQQRNYAADSLYNNYLRKENYIEAEKYIAYFSEQNPERKRKQAVLYSKTGRTEGAWKAYEELVLSMHMSFKKQDRVFVEEMRKNLLECFADQETFGFLKNEKRYMEIIQRRDH